MEEDLKQFLDKLVAECLEADIFAALSEEEKKVKAEEIKQYLQLFIFQTLLNNLNPAQLRELDQLDFTSPEADQKIAEMSASIPSFGLLLQMKLQQQADLIKQTGTITQNES